MKKRKTILSLILTVAMMLSTIPPVMVFAASDYTVSLSASAETVNSGETVDISVDVTSVSVATYNAFYAVLNYDSGKFTYSGEESVNGFSIDNSTAGKLKLSKTGSDVKIREGSDLTLSFTAKAGGKGSFSLTGAKVDVAANAEQDAPEAMIGEAVAVEIPVDLITEIRTEQDLRDFADSVNAGADYTGITVKLEEDVSLTGEWTPIGSLLDVWRDLKPLVNPFTGIFDGCGHTIKGLSVTETPSRGLGLFGSVSDAEIKNLTVRGNIRTLGYPDTISSSEECLYYSGYAGGIVGYAAGDTRISNCCSAVNIEEFNMTSGGIAGYAKTVTGCTNYGTITMRDDEQSSAMLVGGIVADGAYSVKNCINYGTISGYRVGGICGHAYGAISASTNKGTINCSVAIKNNNNGPSAGGILAWAGNTLKITDCYNTGCITANATMSNESHDPYTAGIFGGLTYPGMYGLYLTNCYNTGTITKETGSTEVRYGELVPDYDWSGDSYNGFKKKEKTAFVNNCYTGSEIAKEIAAGEAVSKLGSAYVDKGDGTPILYWEAEGYGSECEVTFQVSGPNEYSITVKDGSSNVIEPEKDGTYRLISGDTCSYEISASGYITERGSLFVKPEEKQTVEIELIKGASVSLTVDPESAELVLTDGNKTISPESQSGGVYRYLLVPDQSYQYMASSEGYLSKKGSFKAVDGDALTIQLTSSEGITEIQDNEFHITKAGTYTIEEGYTGNIYLDTNEPVMIVGTGISPECAYEELTVKATVPGIDLTVENLYIKETTPGTSSGETTVGQNILDVTGIGNRLSFSGENLFENIGYVQSALIHVGKGSELTLAGDGTLYLYKYTQGCGIGGNTEEACGKIIFESGQYYLKGSKTGAVIGGDAMDGSINEDIIIDGGTFNLETNGQGAAIGSSKEGSCAGDVYLNGGNVTITTDFSGSAIGYGGGAKGSAGNLIVTGGSLKTYLTDNSAGQWGLSSAAISDVIITAFKKSADGDSVYRLVFDTGIFNEEEIVINVDEEATPFYQGGLHIKEYSKSDVTIENWVDSTDQNLYLYLTGEEHTLKVSDGMVTKNYDVTWKEDTKEFLISEAGVVSHTVTFTGEHAQAVVNGNTQTSVSVTEGDTLTFSIQSDTGYDVSGAALAGETGTLKDNGDGTYILSALTADTTVRLDASLKQYPVEFDVTPKDAVVTVIDSEGSTVSPMEGTANQFLLTHGMAYTYGASRLGYKDASGTITPTSERTGEDAVIVTLRLSQNSETGKPPQDTPAWDGSSVDISWYDESKDTFTISTGAQLAGLAALVNGLVNEDCMIWDGSIWVAAEDWNRSSYVIEKVGEGSGGGNNMSTDTYHYGICNFTGKTILIDADLDMTVGNYMPVGGQYLMKRDTSETKIDASFNGTFDGQGHNITVKCNRWCSNGNFGDGQAVGLIGRLGVHDNDPVSMRTKNPAVRNVSVSGSVYANRSVGGIVGKVGKTTYSNGTDEYGGIIENCANYASVKGTDAKGTGGVVGSSWNGALVQNCYNAGPVETTFTNSVGGISGSNEGLIRNCYNVGEITGERTTTTAIATENGGGRYENCHWLEDSADVGVYKNNKEFLSDDSKKSSDAMKTDNFVTTLGDAFAKDTGSINNGYPILKWQGGTEPQPVDKSALESALEAAQNAQKEITVSTDGSDVEPENQWVPQDVATALENAVKAAQAVKADDAATQDQVDQAVKDLNDQIKAYNDAKQNGTKKPAVDKTALIAAITAAQDELGNTAVSVDGSDVDPEKYWIPQSAKDKFLEDIAAAQAVADRDDATQDEVSQVLTDLNLAKIIDFDAAKKPGTKTETPVVDKTALQSLIDSAQKELDETQTSTTEDSNALTPGTVWAAQEAKKALADAIGAAQTVNAAEDASQESVDKAVDDLTKALADFRDAKQTVKAANADTLNAAIATARQKLNQTVESADGTDVPKEQQWATAADRKALNDAIDAADAVAKSAAEKPQKDVDEALDALNKAVNAFQPKDGTKEDTVPVDRKALTDAIDAAQKDLDGTKVSAENGTDVDPSEKWVDEAAAKALNDAIAAAQNIAAKADATQEEVDAAKDALDKAVSDFDQAKQNGIPADRSKLQQALNKAEQLLTETKDSPAGDGSDVAATDQWAPQEAKDALKAAVADAKTADQDGTAQSKVDAAVQKLSDAMTAFESTRKPGSKEDVPPVDVSRLTETIAAAQSDRKQTKVSEENGTDVDPAEKWVNTKTAGALDDAIAAAQAVATKADVTQKEADAAADTLKKAQDAFDQAKQAGKPADRKVLQDALAQARKLLNETLVSEDGSNVAPTEQWTTQAARDALSQAVTGAGASDQDGTPQSKVDAAAQSLKDAVSAFENARKAGTKEDAVPVDRKALTDAIDAAQKDLDGTKTSSENGTDVDPSEKWVDEAAVKALNDAIAAAQNAAAKADATQEEVDAAKAALDKAVSDFDQAKKNGTPADRKGLQDALSQAQQLLEGTYESADGSDVKPGEKWAEKSAMDTLKQAVAAAQTSDQDGIPQSKVNAAEKALKDAIAAFENVQKTATPADKTALNQLIADAVADRDQTKVSADGSDVEPENQWVPQSAKDSLNGMISAAQTIAGQDGATQKVVDAAKTALENAIADFNKAKKPGTKTETPPSSEADKTALSDTITAAQSDRDATKVSLDGSDVEKTDQWVPQSAADALKEAIEAAQAVKDKPDATQDEVDAAAEALKQAQKAFDEAKQDGTKEEPPAEVDKGKLDEAIQKAKKDRNSTTVAASASDVDKGEKWVPQSAANDLKAAIEAAQAVKDNADATQEQVDQAVKDLNDAVKDFDAAKKNGTKSSSSGGNNSGNETKPQYPVTLPSSVSSGQVKADKAQAKKGETVKLTPTPAEGYEVDQISVKDKNGKAVTLKDNGDGTYSFTMPDSKVTVDVSYKEKKTEPQPGPGPVDDHDATCPSKAFSDLDTSQWYHEAIDYVLLKNYFNGVGEGKFEPNGTMTRAMFVTVLGRVAGVKADQTAHSSFGDVPDDQWYTPYVDWAADNGIITGYDSETFGPDDPVTREQMAAILYRYAKYKGVDVTAVDATRFHTFSDTDQVSNYAKAPMIWATDKGIINGMGDGTLAPQEKSTRAQVAQIIMNYDQKMA